MVRIGARPRWLLLVVALAATLLLRVTPGQADASNVIMTIAGGNGDGPALNLSMVAGSVAATADHKLYIADGDGTYHVVRALDLTTGEMTVVAGTGAVGNEG